MMNPIQRENFKKLLDQIASDIEHRKKDKPKPVTNAWQQYGREYYRKNRERIAAQQKACRERNKEKYAAYMRKYRREKSNGGKKEPGGAGADAGAGSEGT